MTSQVGDYLDRALISIKDNYLMNMDTLGEGFTVTRDAALSACPESNSPDSMGTASTSGPSDIAPSTKLQCMNKQSLGIVSTKSIN